MLTEGMTSSGSVEWATPDSLFKPLDALWDFTLDGAASHENAKVDRYCTVEGTFQRVESVCTCVTHLEIKAGTGLVMRHDDGQYGSGLCYLMDPNVQAFGAVRIFAEDGLNFPWKDERVFLNPPWGDLITEFVRKCRLESLRYGAKVVVILPARMDTAWMHDHVLGSAQLRYVRGRPKFVDPEAEQRKAAGLPARTAPPVGIVIATYR